MAPSLTSVVASEDATVEAPALDLLASLGWERANLLHEEPGLANPTGRTSQRQAYLPAHLCAALAKLNPALPPEALQLAEDELFRDRSALDPVAANREVLRKIVDGVRVEVRRPDGNFEEVTVRVIDWKDPRANHFLAANQVWIEGPRARRRPDTIGFVNGIPLLFAEWKSPTKPVHHAYEDNLRDYKDEIRHVFDANGFVILSNGIDNLIGAAHAPYRFFAPWRRLTEPAPYQIAEASPVRDVMVHHIDEAATAVFGRDCFGVVATRQVVPMHEIHRLDIRGGQIARNLVGAVNLPFEFIMFPALRVAVLGNLKTAPAI